MYDISKLQGLNAARQLQLMESDVARVRGPKYMESVYAEADQILAATKGRLVLEGTGGLGNLAKIALVYFELGKLEGEGKIIPAHTPRATEPPKPTLPSTPPSRPPAPKTPEGEAKALLDRPVPARNQFAAREALLGEIRGLLLREKGLDAEIRSKLANKCRELR